MATAAKVIDKFARNVAPTYGRFAICLSHGEGSSVWDVAGRRYLDMAGGIAVNSLGHCHPRVVETIRKQCASLMHVSNLYYFPQQADLASRLNGLFEAPGKVFFSNSGVEANEGLFKLARAVGRPLGRYEVITADASFHGRTMGAIAATGQAKIKKGFEPMMEGFSHVPFNDIAAIKAAIGSKTAAVLIEGVQGEGGILPATAEYLLGLRELCDEHQILLMMDAVQCGHFRTGRFQSYQTILESAGADPEAAAAFRPDACSMAKSLGAGFPIGAFWVADAYGDALGPGSHGSTFGGNPLACAVASTVLDVIEEEDLGMNARLRGEQLNLGLRRIAARRPDLFSGVRGLGLMMGLEMQPRENVEAFSAQEGASSIQFVNRLHDEDLLTVPSGERIVRFLPPLNLSCEDVEECLEKIERAAAAV